MRDRILAFIKANPGCKGGAVCAHVGKRSCDREVDKTQQALRRAGLIEYRKGFGWLAKEHATEQS